MSDWKPSVPTEVVLGTEVKIIFEEFNKRFGVVLHPVLLDAMSKIDTNKEILTLDVQTQVREGLILTVASPENKDNEVFKDSLFSELFRESNAQAGPIELQKAIENDL